MLDGSKHSPSSEIEGQLLVIVVGASRPTADVQSNQGILQAESTSLAGIAKPLKPEHLAHVDGRRLAENLEHGGHLSNRTASTGMPSRCTMRFQRTP